MKKLLALLCLLPSSGWAQSSSTNSFTVGAPATPLIRMSAGQACQGYAGARNSPGTGGVVRMTYVVGKDGEVSAVTITGSSDSPLLDRNATDCVKSWKFVSPQRFGLQSVSGQASVTYSTTAKGSMHFSTAQWDAPGLRQASDIAVSNLTAQAIECLRARPGTVQMAAESKDPSTYRLDYFRGEIFKVVVLNSSGSEALDKEGVACFMAVPKNEARAEILDKVGNSTLTFPWHTLFQQAATH